MKYGLSQKDLDLITNEIKNNLGTTANPKLYIYGSRIKGSFREFSDIDLLLVVDQYDDAALSKIDFSELDLSYKVDFVLEKDLYQGYKEEVFQHMELIL